MRSVYLTIFSALLWTYSQSETLAQAPALNIKLTEIATGLNAPVYLTHSSDHSTRLYVLEQAGKIKIVENAAILATPFLDISTEISSGGERGLLGLAFHPDYQSNRRFFIYVTNPQGDIEIFEYKASAKNSLVADPASKKSIIQIPHPKYGNHNGGCLKFGPDGYLYFATGDGGGAGDTRGNAQNLSSLLGKMLRIDINAKAGTYQVPHDNPFTDDLSAKKGIKPEIWAYGLRNPWRFSFDRKTGVLYAGDVGQNRVEEIDIIERGANYGWNIMEGMFCFKPEKGCLREKLKMPIQQYARKSGTSIIGGYIYRGKKIPELTGKYLFGDFTGGMIWTLTPNANDQWSRADLIAAPGMISSFGEDQAGELYVLGYQGNVYRIDPAISNSYKRSRD
ncbi:PQQ-dependent sugar dehydrogenase [bacterium]|nr:PQQ-dependent sugar dehydrogenase [bacterium]